MNWIRVDVALPTHRKMLDLEASLGETVALTYMVRLWCWAKSSAAHGRITGGNAVRNVETAVGWKGAPGAFVRAAIDAGFLHDKAGNLLVHDWYEHNGKALKQARDAAERSRRWRINDKENDEKGKQRKELTKVGETRTSPTGEPYEHAGRTRTRTKSAPYPARTNEQTNEQTNERTTAAGTPPPFALEAESSGTTKPRKLTPAQKLREDLRGMRATAFPGVVDDVEIKPAALTATFDRLEKEAASKGATLVEAYSAYLRGDFARGRNPPCPLSLFVDGNKFRECLSAALRSRGAGPALTLVSGHPSTGLRAGGYASQAEIEAQDFTVDRYDEARPEGA